VQSETAVARRERLADRRQGDVAQLLCLPEAYEPSGEDDAPWAVE
jgi:hypothetical protein